MGDRVQILLIEDEPMWQRELSSILKDQGYEVQVANTFEEAAKRLAKQSVEVAIVDISLVAGDPSDRRGFKLLDILGQSDVPVICVSGYLDPSEVGLVMGEGLARWYFHKSKFVESRDRFVEAVSIAIAQSKQKSRSRWHEMERRTKEQAFLEATNMLSLVLSQVAHRLANVVGTIPLIVIDIERRLEKIGVTDAEVFARLRDLRGDTRQVLDMAKNLSIKGVGAVENLDLASTITHAQNIAKIAVVYPNTKVHVDIAKDASRVSAVKPAIVDIFANLLHNAAQASATVIHITACVAEDGDTVVIRVTDNGVGISQENLQRIFMPFFSSRKKGESIAPAGTGLGLWLARHQLAQMKGNIELETSEIGKGTTFRVTLKRP